MTTMISETLETVEVIDKIVRINRRIADFWGDSYGWAPSDAADLLSKARLDRQVSLSACLRIWLQEPPDDQKDGHLILAWANLGTLIEGTMKFFLCVFESDYSANPVLDKKQNPRDSDELMLETLRQFFLNTVWTNGEKERWGPFVEKVRQRRNGIHAYKNRNIGDRKEFQEAIQDYMDFLSDINATVPYPNPNDYADRL